MADSTRLTDYIERVTRGEGFMPWQERNPESVDEREFRAKIEERKYALLGAGVRDQRPALTTDEHIERIQRNIRDAEWARAWFESRKSIADEAVEKGSAWIDAMIPELTPTARYSYVCPACFGVKSHEGSSQHRHVGLARARGDYVSAMWAAVSRRYLPGNSDTCHAATRADAHVLPQRR